MRSTNASRGPALALIAILSLGVALRLVQYAANGSLWIDELFIALNVTRKGPGGLLLGPLDYNQVASIGFLAVEKLATAVLGPNELALRLFPTLFSIVSLGLFWRVSRRLLSGAPLYASLALFAINPISLWTARNAKQYSGDIMVTLLLILFALKVWEGRDDRRFTVLAGALGGGAILLSQPAVLVATGLCIVLLAQRLRSRDSAWPLLPLAAGWGSSAAVATVTSLILSPPSTRRFMRVGWEYAFVDPPWVDPVSVPRLVFRFVGYLFGSMIPNSPPEIALAGALTGVALVGGGWLISRGGWPAALVLMPLIVALLAATVRLLPFSGRVAAYVGPTCLIAFGAGMMALRGTSPKWLRALGTAAVLALATAPALALLLLMPPLYHREHARPILEEIRARWQPGDVVYVLNGGQRAMEFYGEPLGLVPWFAGGDHERAPRAYLGEADAFRGRPRVWLFYTHASPCEPETLVSYLETIGRRVESIEDTEDDRGKREAAAFLYDLSDRSRLRRSSAATHPVPTSRTDCDRPPESQEEILKRKLRALVGVRRGRSRRPGPRRPPRR